MTIVQKGNQLYALTDDIQVSAFLSCGWVKYDPSVKKEVVKEEKVEAVAETEEVKDELDGMNLKELRAIAKAKGINSFQKNAETLREEIRKK